MRKKTKIEVGSWDVGTLEVSDFFINVKRQIFRIPDLVLQLIGQTFLTVASVNVVVFIPS